MEAILDSFRPALALRAAGHAGSLEQLEQQLAEQHGGSFAPAHSAAQPSPASALAPAAALTAFAAAASTLVRLRLLSPDQARLSAAAYW